MSTHHNLVLLVSIVGLPRHQDAVVDCDCSFQRSSRFYYDE